MRLSRDEEAFLRHWMYDEVHYQDGPGRPSDYNSSTGPFPPTLRFSSPPPFPTRLTKRRRALDLRQPSPRHGLGPRRRWRYASPRPVPPLPKRSRWYFGEIISFSDPDPVNRGPIRLLGFLATVSNLDSGAKPAGPTGPTCQRLLPVERMR